MRREEVENEIVLKITKVLSEEKLNSKELLSVVIKLIYSVGFSLSEFLDNPTNEDVLKAYASKPSMGNSLMAQALYMRDTWFKEPKEEKE